VKSVLENNTKVQKNAIYVCNFKGYEIMIFEHFRLQKLQKGSEKSKFIASKCVKMAVFGTPKFLNLFVK